MNGVVRVYVPTSGTVRTWFARRAILVVALGLALAACSKRKAARNDAGADAGGIDPSELAGKFDKKCVAGDLEACRSLGVMYTEGTGVSPDPRRAAALFGQACNGGNLSACNHLALAIAEGIGVPKDVPRAVEVYQKACDRGFALSCRNLGLMLRDGRGIPADLPRAAKLLDAACKGKVPFACTNAGDLDSQLAIKGGPARAKAAIAHYQLGCDAGDPTACRQIGIAYLEARGLPRSTRAASIWLERACTGDDAIACRVLGAMSMEGVGVPRDPKRGQELLQRACDRKDDEACRLVKLGTDANASDGGVPDASGAGSDSAPANPALDAGAR
ncbi:MAG: SEL1-like repeat protein [Kofleriaceae bacterium]|nr:SEL1-like repeat protein [Kofleriaceae bacterium]